MGILSAKMYVGNLRDNVIRSMNFNWNKGKWQGLAPIGYLNKRDEDNKATIELDPVRYPLVKRLFEEYATGLYSLQGLEDLSKEIGLYNKRVKKDKPLGRNDIWNLLQNPFYYGVMRIKGNLIQHIYEPIIDKTLFDIVQDVLKGRSRPPLKNSYGTIPFVFRGLVKCSCGCTISPEPHKKKSGKKYMYLKCSHQKGDCNQGLVNENVILDQLEHEVFHKLNVPESMIDRIKSDVRNLIKNEENITATTKRGITLRINGLKDKENRLFDMFLEGDIDKTTYESKKALIEKERTELQETEAKYTEVGDDIDKTLENIVEIAGSARNLMASSNVNQKRELLGLILANPCLEGKKLRFSILPPWNQLLKTTDCLKWSGRHDLNMRLSAPKADTLPD